ncbi:hypothetical protein 000TH008_135 [Bacillus phage 000TH008]|nr:hypothetical protein 000TH008_135 [Bacillus phage 000TH008]QQO40829.1 hypothetical protein 000TH009_135 [Bacillus phage 000TH009]
MPDWLKLTVMNLQGRGYTDYSTDIDFCYPRHHSFKMLDRNGFNVFFLVDTETYELKYRPSGEELWRHMKEA